MEGVTKQSLGGMEVGTQVGRGHFSQRAAGKGPELPRMEDAGVLEEGQAVQYGVGGRRGEGGPGGKGLALITSFLPL